MTSLFEAELGPGAGVTQSHHGIVRRAQHGNASILIDTDDQIALVLNLSDTHVVEARMGRLSGRGAPRIGSVSVIPPGCRAQFTIVGQCRVMMLQLPWCRWAHAAAEALDLDPARVIVEPSINADNPSLARAIYHVALAAEDDTDRSMVRLASLLAEQRWRGAQNEMREPAKGGIAPIRLRRVLDKIDHGLPEAVPLKVLASEAGMSLFHFAREFASSTGIPPHQFVVRRRVERAIQLLARRDLTIEEVALRTGFVDGGHLARHLRRATGATPNVFRGRVLP